MPRTLNDLKRVADERLAENRPIDALKVYRLVLEGVPLDFELRQDIAVILQQLGESKLAVAVLEAVADHNIKSGIPLSAMVALKRLEQLQHRPHAKVDDLLTTYSTGSVKLGRGVRPAPANLSAAVRDDIDLDYPIEDRELKYKIAQMAAYTENIENYPDVVPPVQIFSTLSHEAFSKLFDRLELSDFKAGGPIIKQGQIGQSVYFLARGEVSVVKEGISAADGGEQSIRLARLGAGSLFGEMALLSKDPRGASVICDTSVSVLRLKRSDVEELAGRLPQIAGALMRFTQERMISNLLATNPLFKPFDAEEKTKLLGRFKGHDVPQGTIFLEQGAVGPGLYVVLKGKAEVLKWGEGQYIKLADLGPGDIAGEISLLFEEKVSATVRTTTPATLLFLARELFKPLVDAVPDLLAYFNKLAEERLADTELKMMQTKVTDEDYVEAVDEAEELADDDIVFI